MHLRILFFFVLLSRLSWGAACCSSGGGNSNLIVGDDAATLGISMAFSRVIGNVSADGVSIFRASSDREWIHTYTLDAAYMISDRWQLGAAIPLVRHFRDTGEVQASSLGWGDASLFSAFEAIPEYSYSNWKPRLFVFGQLRLPTGQNVHASTASFAIDAHGKGFWTPTLGLVLVKVWDGWDLAVRAAAGHGIGRHFATPTGQRWVQPGWEGALTLAGGWSPSATAWRFGLSLAPTFETASNVGSSKLLWELNVEASYLIDRIYLVNFGYLDQTIFGPARNVTLNRGLFLGLRRKWER